MIAAVCDDGASDRGCADMPSTHLTDLLLLRTPRRARAARGILLSRSATRGCPTSSAQGSPRAPGDTRTKLHDSITQQMQKIVRLIRIPHLLDSVNDAMR